MPRQLLTVALVVALIVVGTTSAVTAQSDTDDGNLLEDITGGELTLTERISATNDAIAGLLSRASYEAASVAPVGDESGGSDATLAADELASTYNEHNDTIESYVNARFEEPATDWDVIQVDVTVDEETTTRYLVANTTADGTFTDSAMVSSTDREVDQSVEVRDYAAENADAELQTFVEEYIAQNRDTDAALRRRLANQYGGYITLPEDIQ